MGEGASHRNKIRKMDCEDMPQPINKREASACIDASGPRSKALPFPAESFH